VTPDFATIEAATPKCPVGPNRPGLTEAPEPCNRRLSYAHDAEMWVCPEHGHVTTTQSLVHRQNPVRTARRPYTHYRADGWPYCPQCDEDELWSNATYATIDTIVGCYRCDWKPVPPEATS
jgi:predicted RNA-binding Zn-ribbon protein involved in translation (DUF1610 family)